MNYTKAINEKFQDIIKRYNMFCGQNAVLCGYSGGADSTALLHLMRLFCSGHNIRLAAVHVNHMIRGEEAESDERHCVRFCEEQNIELFVRRVNIPEIAANEGLGTEETARRERYRIFNMLCASDGFGRTAVAHNAGDNFETVLFNMLRGTGIRGLCGIPPVRGSIIRPLIECSKAEITGYCNENRLAYVTDSTNADTNYTRNFIRHEIIPLTERVNGSAEENVTRMCASLRRDSNYLDMLAKDERFAGDESEALLTRRIMQSYASFTGGGQLESVHISDAVRLLREGRLHSSVSLPGLVAIRKTRSGFAFENEDSVKPEPFCVPLRTGINDLGPAGVIYLYNNLKYIKEIKNIYKLFIHKTLYSDNINGGLYIRNRRSGDIIHCGGMTKSVKKLLCEKKIAPRQRSSLPFICDGDGILWIPGVALRDGAEAQCDGEKTLYICYAKNFTE